jgi:hypothetical protein
MRGASVDCDIQSNTALPVRFASFTYGRKPGNTAASSHRDSVSWRTPALEFLHIVWTKREMTHREKLVWMAKQKRPGAEQAAEKVFLERHGFSRAAKLIENTSGFSP